jgi:hypothetical protein
VSAVQHTLRAATYADVEPVATLLREVCFKARSEAGWRWLFEDNPAHRRREAKPEMGWVLERDGVVQGYLGNVHLDYVLDGKPLRAATCTSYYVRPIARADSARLMSAFFRQQGVELFLSTTANALSDPIYRLFKAAVPEGASFCEGLVWVADDRRALHGTLVKAGLPQALAGGLAAVTAPAARVARALTGFATAPRDARAAAVSLMSPADIDERFDELWRRVSAAPGLRVVRDAATLRWYFSDPDAGSEPVLFALSDEEGLVGYAAAVRHRPAEAPASQLRILDLVVRPGEERAIPTLLCRVLSYARDASVGLVYCPPCGAPIAQTLKSLHPYTHHHDYASHYLRASERGRTAALTGAGTWQATGLDGDTPFCIEYYE